MGSSTNPGQALSTALWRLYHRPTRPRPWSYGGNLPWDDPAFSERMLREHLDQTHGAASRTTHERQQQLAWLWDELQLAPGQHLLDITCGPGLYAVPLAERGLEVTGIDFAPAAIRYARELAEARGVTPHCRFIQADVRGYNFGVSRYDAALLLYGQLAVMSTNEAQTLLTAVAQALKPGSRLIIELLDQEHVDKDNSSWWYTDDTGLWGDTPYLHLGERQWREDDLLSLERYIILHLETGEMDEIILCDQTYSIAAMKARLAQAGFVHTTAQPNWAGLPLYDAAEWVIYTAVRPA